MKQSPVIKGVVHERLSIREARRFLQQRPLAFAFMQRLFARELDGQALGLLASQEALGALLEYDSGAKPGKDMADMPTNDLRAFATLLGGLASKGDDDVLEQLSCEFARFFIGPEPPMAPLWESVYFDPRELLFVASTQDVKRRYEREGFRVESNGRVAEDSLALMLEFMAHLALRAVEALDQDLAEYHRLLEAQFDFEHTHLLNWLPALAKRADASSGTWMLYPRSCAVVAAMVCEDARRIEMLMTES